ncbi:hypothetical protein FSP39_019761 [Pinctada imbricata]|uniref:Uncharacterized protein n=1 Tax=Pinctada imbricata TaxID=66713 RepID=A0AA89C992_PINIB|nr:hypothetical protein FSP39_019761 [Pinctada imbricata]
MITEIISKPSIVTLRERTSSILQRFYERLLRQDGMSEKISITKTAEDLIKSDIRCIDANRETYQSSKDVSSLAQNYKAVPDVLRVFLYLQRITDFNTNPMTTRLSRAVFSETAVTDESSDLTLGKKNSNCCKTEASQNGLNATTPLDNSTGHTTTSEIRRTMTKVHVQVPQRQGKGVGIGLGCTTAFLVALAIVVLLIKYRTRLKDLTVPHSNNQRISVHMDSLYDDILEEGQASRRAFTVGTSRVSYDSIPGTGEAGIYSEISPEGTNRNRNTTVSAEVTHYARTNQDMCVYNHLNEAQEGHRNTYEEFSVYNLLSKQSTRRESKTFDNEYDCSDSIKNRHDDVL